MHPMMRRALVTSSLMPGGLARGAGDAGGVGARRGGCRGSRRRRSGDPGFQGGEPGAGRAGGDPGAGDGDASVTGSASNSCVVCGACLTKIIHSITLLIFGVFLNCFHAKEHYVKFAFVEPRGADMQLDPRCPTLNPVAGSYPM